jgi:hypothetical protein
MKIYYLPNIAYFQELITLDIVRFDLEEVYRRQTYRNRTEIVGANGKMVLSIPTQKLEMGQRAYQNIKISYSEPWLKQHWKSLESAYRRSAYFEFYEDKLKLFYEKPTYEYLWEYNFGLTKFLMNALKIEKEIQLEEEVVHEDSYSNKLKINKKYFQVFSNKMPFVENLSVLDLLFNMGPSAKIYLASK